MAVVFECKILGEHEPKADGVSLSLQPQSIPVVPGNSPMIDIRDMPEVIAVQIGRRGDRVRVTIEKIPG